MRAVKYRMYNIQPSTKTNKPLHMGITIITYFTQLLTILIAVLSLYTISVTVTLVITFIENVLQL